MNAYKISNSPWIRRAKLKNLLIPIHVDTFLRVHIIQFPRHIFLKIYNSFFLSSCSVCFDFLWRSNRWAGYSLFHIRCWFCFGWWMDQCSMKFWYQFLTLHPFLLFLGWVRNYLFVQKKIRTTIRLIPHNLVYEFKKTFALGTCNEWLFGMVHARIFFF